MIKFVASLAMFATVWSAPADQNTLTGAQDDGLGDSLSWPTQYHFKMNVNDSRNFSYLVEYAVNEDERLMHRISYDAEETVNFYHIGDKTYQFNINKTTGKTKECFTGVYKWQRPFYFLKDYTFLKYQVVYDQYCRVYRAIEKDTTSDLFVNAETGAFVGKYEDFYINEWKVSHWQKYEFFKTSLNSDEFTLPDTSICKDPFADDYTFGEEVQEVKVATKAGTHSCSHHSK
ncbi:hypothetical protein MIR68_002806 [Amoeboaphelidium protococcarum]|nr:hypothetical protein MIR68_002806 [Amoeboaphelidium protococcarum]